MSEDELCFVCGKEPLHEDGQCPACWAETQRLMAKDSSKQFLSLYDLPGKRALWEEVMADTKRLLGETLRGYTDQKLLTMDPFLLRDRLDAMGCDSGRRWVALLLQLPGDFPANNELAFFRVIAQQQFADAGFGTARKAFYGEP